MSTRYFSALFLMVVGTCASAVGCGGSASGSPPRDGGAGASQTGAAGSGSGGGNNATGGNDATGGNAGGAGGALVGAGGSTTGAGGSGGTIPSGVAGSAGSSPDAGRTDGGGQVDAAGTACEKAAAGVDKTCTAVTDCIVVTHQTDYMGQTMLLGIRSSEMAHFATLEAACHATKNNFKTPAVTADDGSLVAATAKTVACQAGLCTTYSAACMQPCAAGHVCITCGATSVCSQLCVASACTEAPRTSCLGGTSTDGGEGDFCFDPKFASGFMSSSCHR
ncbi:MAG TPA: hypothetical protein VMT47_18075 [Polyangia bacterium]|nr:hypothetical protein [Polyangia bacterium]